MSLEPWHVVGGVVYVIGFISSLYFVMGVLNFTNNGGNLGERAWWYPFQFAWEEMLENLPRGTEHRKRKLLALINEFERGSMSGKKQRWSFNELRSNPVALEDVAEEYFGSPIQYWAEMLLVVVFWPLSLVFFLFVFVALAVLTFIDRGLSAIFD